MTTSEHISNLRKLADFLISSVPPPEFSMGTWFSARYGFSKAVTAEVDMLPIGKPELGTLYYLDAPRNVIIEEYTDPKCGTVACAVGHGPLAGIPIADSDATWHRYMERSFGVTEYSTAYYWMFSPDWKALDDTPRGAASRIHYYADLLESEDDDAINRFLENTVFDIIDGGAALYPYDGDYNGKHAK